MIDANLKNSDMALLDPPMPPLAHPSAGSRDFAVAAAVSRVLDSASFVALIVPDAATAAATATLCLSALDGRAERVLSVRADSRGEFGLPTIVQQLLNGHPDRFAATEIERLFDVLTGRSGVVATGVGATGVGATGVGATGIGATGIGATTVLIVQEAEKLRQDATNYLRLLATLAGPAAPRIIFVGQPSFWQSASQLTDLLAAHWTLNAEATAPPAHATQEPPEQSPYVRTDPASVTNATPGHVMVASQQVTASDPAPPLVDVGAAATRTPNPHAAPLERMAVPSDLLPPVGLLLRSLPAQEPALVGSTRTSGRRRSRAVALLCATVFIAYAGLEVPRQLLRRVQVEIEQPLSVPAPPLARVEPQPAAMTRSPAPSDAASDAPSQSAQISTPQRSTPQPASTPVAGPVGAAGADSPETPPSGPATADPGAAKPASVTPPGAEPDRVTPRSSAEAAGVKALIGRADRMLALGDIASARLLYVRAADQGSGHAAAALGMTYDPDFLARFNGKGPLPDAGLAARWYRRALALGDTDAAVLVDRLAKGAPDR